MELNAVCFYMQQVTTYTRDLCMHVKNVLHCFVNGALNVLILKRTNLETY